MQRIFRQSLLCVALSAALGACKNSGSLTDTQYLAKAREFQAAGKMQEALIEIKNAIQKNPQSGEARWQLGEAYVRLGQGAQAEKELLKAEELGIGIESLKIPLGRAYLLQGKFDRVVEEIEAGPNTSDANASRILALRGEALFMQGRQDDGCALFANAQKKDANQPTPYLGLARCAITSRKHDEALAQIEAALKLDPNYAETWNMRGNVRYAKNDLQGAEADFTKAVQLDAHHAIAQLGRALTRLDLGNLAGARKDVDAVLKLQSSMPLAHHLSGVTYFHQAKYVEAQAEFEAARKSGAGFPPAVLWLGLCAYAQKDYEQAIQHLSAFVRSYPNASDAKALLAVLQARAGAKPEAQKLLDSLGRDVVENPKSLANVGRAYTLIGRADLGVVAFAEAVKRQPESVQAVLQLAMALLAKGDSKQALAQIDRALELDPNSLRAEELKVQVLLQDKRFDDALAALDRLQVKFPNDPLPYSYRGNVLLSQGKKQLARAAFEQALKIKPSFVPAAQNLAQLALQDKDYAQARGYLQQVLAVEKDNLPTTLTLAALEQAAGKPQQAIALLETARAAHPNAPEVASVLGRLYLNSGNATQVLEATREAASTHDDNAALLEVRGLAFTKLGDRVGAVESFGKLAQIQPKSAEAHFYLATARAAAGDVAGTRRALETVLALKPDHAQAKLALSRLGLVEGKVEEAQRLADMQTGEGQAVVAEGLLRRKKVGEAIALLEKAAAKYPNTEVVFSTLARAYLAAGERKRALDTATAYWGAHKDSAGANRLAAEIYLQAGTEQQTKDALEALLKIVPDDAVALNNLAWLLRNSDVARALQLATKATQLKPEAAAYWDTLGWMLVEQGKGEQGVSALRKAHEMAPRHSGIHYRYAEALARAGEKAQAKREIERLLKDRKGFAEETQARALLSKL